MWDPTNRRINNMGYYLNWVMEGLAFLRKTDGLGNDEPVGQIAADTKQDAVDAANSEYPETKGKQIAHKGNAIPKE